MEIIIKTKQKFNPYFSFLNHEDGLYPYYRYLKEVISSGTYVLPVILAGNGVEVRDKSKVMESKESVRGSEVDAGNEEEEEEEGQESEGAEEGQEIEGAEEGQKEAAQEHKPSAEPADKAIGNGASSESSQHRSKSNSVDDSDSDSSDSDDEGYLHPLLLGGGAASKSKGSSPAPPPKSESSLATEASTSNSKANMSKVEAKMIPLEEILKLDSASVSFMARSRAINSAPLMAPTTEGEATRADTTDPEAVAAYEYYKQQYYNK